MGGSASSLIASVIASRLKITAICMSPILLLKNYLKHIVEIYATDIGIAILKTSGNTMNRY